MSNATARLKRYREVMEWVDANISVFPIRLDGTKRPIGSWKPYMKRRPAKGEVMEKFCVRNVGVAAITGCVSHGLELLDFDDPTKIEPWKLLLPEGLINRLPIVHTPSGGWHVYYRCRVIGGNQKLAMSKGDAGKTSEVMIETRGEGGYIICPLSPPSVHVANKPYHQVSGPRLPNIPVVSEAERTIMLDAARSFCEAPRQTTPNAAEKFSTPWVNKRFPKPSSGGVETPWDAYSRHADWHEILCPHGWTSPNGINWWRPGKTELGFSAKVGDSMKTPGITVLNVYSSNAGALSNDRGTCRTFNKFSAMAHLDFSGDFSAAARYALTLGYGVGK